MTNANLSISGGTGKTSHYVSLGYFDQTGTITGVQHYRRWNGRVNFDFMATDHLKIGVNITGTHSINHRMDNSFSGQSVLAAALIANPNNPIYNKNGSYFSDPLRRNTNPVMLANSLRFVSGVDSYVGNIYGEYTIAKGLKLRSSLGFDNQQVTDDRYQSTLVNNGSPATGFVSVFNQFLWINENTLSYTPELNAKNHLSFLLGQSAQQASVRRIGFSGSTSSTDIIQSVSGFTALSAPTDYRSAWGLVSYFRPRKLQLRRQISRRRRAAYRRQLPVWREQTLRLLPLHFRRLAHQQRSVHARREIRQRPQAARQHRPHRQQRRPRHGLPSLATYSTGYNYGSEAGIAATSLSNQDLSWESTVASDLGLDMTFLDNRVSVTVDAYNKVTNRLIFKLDLPYTSGFARTNGANIGQLINKGLEIQVNTDNIRGKFNWSTGINFSINRNKITSLPETIEGDPTSSDFTESLPAAYSGSMPTSIFRVGQPVGSFFGYRNKGVDPKTGNMIYDDINHDGKITAADRVILGNALPKFTGGLTNTFSYKGFDMSFFIYASYGNKVYNQTRAFLERMSSYCTTRTYKRLTDGRRPIRPTYPKPCSTTPSKPTASPTAICPSAGSKTDRISASKISRSAISVPQTWTRKARLTSARAYLSAQNLFMITSYSGFDPESQNQSVKNSQLGIDYAVQPQPKVFLAGLSVNF
ncbi:hypothetical protein ACQ86N_17240 [Puia sp. P3]|uniref:hypothetical protein n=1 Tax=Puia sp. P3 TaxID=3423952 RepID=UPI003D673E8A